MSLSHLVVRPLAVAWIGAAMAMSPAMSPALAQAAAETQPSAEYKPTVGQEGKDVI